MLLLRESSVTGDEFGSPESVVAVDADDCESVGDEDDEDDGEACF